MSTQQESIPAGTGGKWETEDYIILFGILGMVIIALVYISMLFYSRVFTEKDSQTIINENRSIVSFADIKTMPVVKDNPMVYPTDVVLFKNRKTGKFLSTCTNCLKTIDNLNFTASVMNVDDKPYEKYNQWSLTFNEGVKGYNLFSDGIGFLTISDIIDICGIKPNKDLGSYVSLIGHDSQGYLIKTSNIEIGDLRLRASENYLQYYSKNSNNGVITINAYEPVSDEDIWDMYIYKDNQLILQNPAGETETLRKITERTLQYKSEDMNEIVNKTLTSLRELKL